MFQYFVKVVPTVYMKVDGEVRAMHYLFNCHFFPMYNTAEPQSFFKMGGRIMSPGVGIKDDSACLTDNELIKKN